jgi:hypothetical protein
MAIPLLQNVDEGIVNDAKVISEAPHWNVSEGMVDDAEVDGKALVITCYECVWNLLSWWHYFLRPLFMQQLFCLFH